jgi:hypothetical protein
MFATFMAVVFFQMMLPPPGGGGRRNTPQPYSTPLDSHQTFQIHNRRKEPVQVQINMESRVTPSASITKQVAAETILTVQLWKEGLPMDTTNNMFPLGIQQFWTATGGKAWTESCDTFDIDFGGVTSSVFGDWVIGKASCDFGSAGPQGGSCQNNDDCDLPYNCNWVATSTWQCQPGPGNNCKTNYDCLSPYSCQCVWRNNRCVAWQCN